MTRIREEEEEEVAVIPQLLSILCYKVTLLLEVRNKLIITFACLDLCTYTVPQKTGAVLHFQITNKSNPLINNFGTKNNKFNLNLITHTFLRNVIKTGNPLI